MCNKNLVFIVIDALAIMYKCSNAKALLQHRESISVRILLNSSLSNFNEILYPTAFLVYNTLCILDFRVR